MTDMYFRHMYRFLPALIYIEKVCRRNGLSAESIAGWFGRELDEAGDDTECGKLFEEYLKNLHAAGIQLDSYHDHRIMSHGLGKPDWNKGYRTIREWDGKPWPVEERAKIEPMDKVQYLMYEQDKRVYYLDKAKEFFQRFR